MLVVYQIKKGSLADCLATYPIESLKMRMNKKTIFFFNMPLHAFLKTFLLQNTKKTVADRTFA